MRPTDANFRKLNKSPTTADEKDALKKMLTEPPVKKIDLHFPLGLEVTARNLKGVTIKDALDAIHKQFKKKVSDSSQQAKIRCVLMNPNGTLTIHLQADDEMELPVLAGFEWDKEKRVRHQPAPRRRARKERTAMSR